MHSCISCAVASGAELSARRAFSSIARRSGRRRGRASPSCARPKTGSASRRQSGMPGFRLALPEVHGELLEVARDEAKLALARDPDFVSPRAEALRLLLYLFGCDEAVRLLRAG